MTATKNQPRGARQFADDINQLRHLRRLGRRPNLPAARRLAVAQIRQIRRRCAAAGLTIDEYVGLQPSIQIVHAAHLPVPALLVPGNGPDEWAIHVRSTSPDGEQRCQIVREFKYCLDAPLVHRLYSPHDKLSHQQAAVAADRFADELLMPARQLRQAARQGDGTPIDIAIRFNVTPQRAEQRLIELGLAHQSEPAGHPEGGLRHGR